MATIAKKELIERIAKKTQCKNITAKEIVSNSSMRYPQNLAKVTVWSFVILVSLKSKSERRELHRIPKL